MGAMRGNENQLLFACSLLINKLRELEENGKLSEEHGILVIPCVNPFSMNVKKVLDHRRYGYKSDVSGL